MPIDPGYDKYRDLLDKFTPPLVLIESDPDLDNRIVKQIGLWKNPDLDQTFDIEYDDRDNCE